MTDSRIGGRSLSKKKDLACLGTALVSGKYGLEPKRVLDLPALWDSRPKQEKPNMLSSDLGTGAGGTITCTEWQCNKTWEGQARHTPRAGGVSSWRHTEGLIVAKPRLSKTEVGRGRILFKNTPLSRPCLDGNQLPDSGQIRLCFGPKNVEISVLVLAWPRPFGSWGLQSP